MLFLFGIPLARNKSGFLSCSRLDPEAARTTQRYGVIMALPLILLGLGLKFYDIRGETAPAYRQATQLELRDAQKWNRLGNSLRRTGKLEEAIAAYRKIEEIGEATGDRSLLAAAYANLGTVYQTRSELQEAEEYYRKAKELNEAMGSEAH